jgi:hypothetical protein
VFFEAVQVKDISDGAHVYLHEVLYTEQLVFQSLACFSEVQRQ